jgi:hypothetical protein
MDYKSENRTNKNFVADLKVMHQRLQIYNSVFEDSTQSRKPRFDARTFRSGKHSTIEPNTFINFLVNFSKSDRGTASTYMAI